MARRLSVSQLISDWINEQCRCRVGQHFKRLDVITDQFQRPETGPRPWTRFILASRGDRKSLAKRWAPRQVERLERLSRRRYMIPTARGRTEMTHSELLIEEFERIRDAAYPAVNGLSFEELAYRPDSQSNSISWLMWHLTRVQDQAVSALSGSAQIWTANGWFERFALALDPSDTGYGHDPATVGAVTSAAAPLLDYFEDVHQRSVGWVRTLNDAALSSVLDETSVPPMTVEGRLIGVIVDDLQHVGQAAYVRGLVQRR